MAPLCVDAAPPDERFVAEVDTEIVGHATVGRFRDGAARRFYERFGFVADGESHLVPVGADYPDARPVEHIRYHLHDTHSA